MPTGYVAFTLTSFEGEATNALRAQSTGEVDPMNISGYRFGKIDIGDKTYTSDVIITPERVIDGWWRQQGHALVVADLDDVMAARPDVLVIGTGYLGRMSVSQETRQYLEAQGIHVRDARTGEAVHDFNELQKERGRVVAALHLTC